MASFTRNIQRLVAALSGPAARCAATSSTAPSAAASLARLGLTRLVPSHQLPYTATPARFSSALAAGRSSAGNEKSQLVQLLEKEIEHEKEHAMPEDEKEVLDFFRNSGWKVQTKEGNDDVTLSKTFGKENVDVTFSLSEINQQEDYNEMDEEEIEEGDDEHVLTVHATVNCEKPGHGTLAFDVTFEQGEVYVHNASHYPSADVAKMKNAEADWQRRSVYPGPVFSELEEDLQNTFSQYLQERGVDNDLAVFAVRYASLGEQREYVNWLHRVRDHLRA